MLGLYEAIMRFDITKNASFTTYLTIWVRKYVSRYLSEDGTIKLIFQDREKNPTVAECLHGL